MDLSQLGQLSGAYLFGGILFGSIATGFFIYGKRTQNFTTMALSAGMLAYPFFVSSTWALYLLGLAFTAALVFYRD